MAGSTLMIVTVCVTAFWAGVMLRLRAHQLTASPQRFHGFRKVLIALVIPSMVAAGLAIDSWGLQTVLVLGSCLAALAFLSLDRSDSLPTALGGTALLAGAIAALTVASIAAMPLAFFPTHAARSINLGMAVALAGGLLGKQITEKAMARLGPRRALLALALVSILPAAGAACVPEAEFDLPTGGSGGQLALLLSDPRMALLMAMIAMCMPLEAALGPWARRFVGELGNYSGTTMLLGVGFWLAFFGSRLFAAAFLPAAGGAIVVLCMTITAAVIFGNMLGAYLRAGTSIGLLLTGACFGPLVPTLFGVVLQSHADATGAAAGLASAAGLLGTLLVLPWIDGSRPERASRVTMRGATALAVVLLAPALVLVILG